MEIERGARIGSSKNHEVTWMLANERARLKTSGSNDKGGFDLKLDFSNDGITRKTEVDLREVRLRYSPLQWIDLSVGQQVSTWGVGDLIFINDLFPKNWVNMFLGRDMELMKDPANVVRVTLYASSWTWDIVWTPEFTPDTTPDGCRFSIFNPNADNAANQQTFGEKTIGNPDACQNSAPVAEQNNQLENSEAAMRLKTQWGSQEVAVYGYNGFWKSPKGMENNSSTGLLEPFYPRMGADKVAVRCKKHLRPLHMALEFSSTAADCPWLKALRWMKTTYSRQQKLSQRPIEEIPEGTISKRLRSYLLEIDGDNKVTGLRADRYEFWIYRQIRKRLDAGDLFLKDSLEHRRFSDELVALPVEVLSQIDIPSPPIGEC
ncbi:hypothetical protein WDW89_00755 [Deltaproteobacteria bacterium TL4]